MIVGGLAACSSGGGGKDACERAFDKLQSLGVFGGINYGAEDATAKHVRGADYWFAADARAPWLHVLLRYEGPGGARYRLKSIERVAYWKRG